MLNRLPILIVEDDPIIALDLASSVEDLEGCVVGPIASVEEALALLDVGPVGGAIIDANLVDRDATPLALALIAQAVPFVFHTGTGIPEALAVDHPDLPVVLKPARSTLVLAALLQRISPDREKFSR